MIISNSTPMRAACQDTPIKELNETTNIGGIAVESQDIVIVAEGSPSSHPNSIFAGNAGSSAEKKDIRSCSSFSSSDEDEIVVIETVQKTPSK